MDTQSDPPPPAATPEVISPASTFGPQTLAIASFSFATLLVALFLFSRRKAKARGNAVLLVGAPDAGKTALFSALTYRTPLPSHASLQTNSAVAFFDKRPLRLIDVPGHPRIRDQFKEHLNASKAVVFVVDAGTISRNGPAVAEHLHHILHALTSFPPSQTPPTLLIAAHKHDLLKSTASVQPAQLAVNRVRTVLERELEKRRSAGAESSGVGSTGVGSAGIASADNEDTAGLGGLDCTGGGAFRFADWEGGPIGFVGTMVEIGASFTEEKPSGGIAPLREWLEEL